MTESDWLMSVSAFFDESGKKDDHKIISFGGVASFTKDFDDFCRSWERLLRANGILGLSAKNVLNPNRPLSRKNDRTGLEKRIQDLLPFVECIRKNLQVVTGTAIDVRAFKKLPQRYLKTFEDNPVYTAFLRSILRVIEFTPDRDQISLIVDDDEETALNFYHLYRRVKRVYIGAKTKLVAISFADDRYLYGLQAADFIASLMRLEVGRTLKRLRYDYRPVFDALRRDPERHERLWDASIAIGDKTALGTVAEGLNKDWEQALKMSKGEK